MHETDGSEGSGRQGRARDRRERGVRTPRASRPGHEAGEGTRNITSASGLPHVLLEAGRRAPGGPGEAHTRRTQGAGGQGVLGLTLVLLLFSRHITSLRPHRL